MDEDWTVEVAPSGGDLIITERLGNVEIGTTTGLLPSAAKVFGVGSLDDHGLTFTVAEVAEAVEVRLASGDVERPYLARVPNSSAKYFAMPLRSGQRPVLVVALAGSGEELARQDLRSRYSAGGPGSCPRAPSAPIIHFSVDGAPHRGQSKQGASMALGHPAGGDTCPQPRSREAGPESARP